MTGSSRKRIRLQVAGIVQGVGFRPFIRNLAVRAGLTGWVFNDSAGVTVEVQGTARQIDDFLTQVRSQLPPLARIDRWVVQEIDLIRETRFVIRPSPVGAGRITPVSPDIAPCEECLAELDDPSNRRYGYPFINCTNCGPRFTIIESVPYDRPRTTMKRFAMCARCQNEYEDPADRRYHAQPNACPECGPAIWFVERGESEESFERRPEAADARVLVRTALDRFHRAIAGGAIVAVKGVGGFHLACDASCAPAVSRLRERKGRSDKPFAVLVPDIGQAMRLAWIDDRERWLLESPERPIVLLRRRASPWARRVGENVAPGNDFIGIMLPYSPLHRLLVAETPLVMTSGNRSDEPIARTNREARERLSDLADGFLLHDRPIEVVCDDSVVRCAGDDLLPIRRSRGYAPLPVRLPEAGGPVLAVGGEIKTTFCLARDDYAFMSQHIGDMGNLETLEALQRAVDHFQKLYRAEPELIVADLHPGYLSGQWAERLAASRGVPLLRVQHHGAHVAALLAEHGEPPVAPLIGVCFDGTGYGLDGTIWGGEFLIPREISGGEVGFDRAAHLAPFPLPGGDASIRHPWRAALALLWQHEVPWESDVAPWRACPAGQRETFRQQLERGFNCVSTSSMGRLFDAVAALLDVRQSITYEAQAAMELEALAAPAIEDACKMQAEIGGEESFDGLFELKGTDPIEIDSAPLIRALVRALREGVGRPILAAWFHEAVAAMVVRVCGVIREERGIERVGLTGGVFQNVLLLRRVRSRLARAGFDVWLHRVVPPNDGGLALGQVVCGRQALLARAK